MVQGKPITFYNVSFTRRYQTRTGEWRSTKSFDKEDLGKLAYLNGQAAEWIEQTRKPVVASWLCTHAVACGSTTPHAGLFKASPHRRRLWSAAARPASAWQIFLPRVGSFWSKAAPVTIPYHKTR